MCTQITVLKYVRVYEKIIVNCDVMVIKMSYGEVRDDFFIVLWTVTSQNDWV